MTKMPSNLLLKEQLLMCKILYSALAGTLVLGIVFIFPKMLVTMLVIFILGLLKV